MTADSRTDPRPPVEQHPPRGIVVQLTIDRYANGEPRVRVESVTEIDSTENAPPRGREAVEQAIDEAMLAAAYASKWDGCLTGDCQHETQDDCNASLLAHMANVADCVAVRAALIALCSPWIAADSPPERLSFAAVLQRVAKRHDFEVMNFAPGTVTGQILLEDAAALRELAERLEQWRESAERLLDFRTHDAHCSWQKTEFCECGMKEAADGVRRMVADLRAGFEPPRQENG